MKTKVAALGAEHSFHDQAVRVLFRTNYEVNRCLTFEAILEAVEKGHADIGVMAIENSVVGCFLPNYMLLKNHEMFVYQELILPIELSLWIHPQNAGKELNQVMSHLIALRQCSLFLSTIPLVEEKMVSDTATAVEMVRDHPQECWGAVAGKEAGEAAGLVALHENVQNRENTWTRFVVFKRKESAFDQKASVNKASWFIRAKDQPGVLLGILEALKAYNILKIQSVPDYEVEGQHGFIVDFAVDRVEDYLNALKQIEGLGATLLELGLYNSKRHGKD